MTDDKVLRAMQRLPLATQILLELHYIHGLSLAELADMDECPIAVIRLRLHLGRQALRELLAGTGLDITDELEDGEA